jgi:hypothetical protein
MFEIGDTAIVDKGYSNECLVEIVKFYSNQICRIKLIDGYEWDVMIYRLSRT